MDIICLTANDIGSKRRRHTRRSLGNALCPSANSGTALCLLFRRLNQGITGLLRRGGACIVQAASAHESINTARRGGTVVRHFLTPSSRPIGRQ